MFVACNGTPAYEPAKPVEPKPAPSSYSHGSAESPEDSSEEQAPKTGGYSPVKPAPEPAPAPAPNSYAHTPEKPVPAPQPPTKY